MTSMRGVIAVVLTGVSLTASGQAVAKQRDDGALPPGQAKKQERTATEALAITDPAPTIAARIAEPAPTPEAKLHGNSGKVKKVDLIEAAAPEVEATPAEVAPAPAPAPAPAAVAAPSPSSAPASRTRRSRPARRRRSAPRTRPVTRRATPVVTSAPRPLAAPRVAARPPVRAPRRATVRRESATEAAQPRALTRLVTRVVEVIPRPVRRALTALAIVAGLLLLGLLAAGLRARRLAGQRRRLMADVGLLQSALLPELEPRVGPAAVSAAYRPAAGLAAGGDFYDAFTLEEDQTCVILGDVAGHGRDAIPVTALVRYTVRAYLEGGLSPRQALQVAGRVLEPQLRDTLVTVLIGIYDAQTGLLTVATAGHPPPVVSTDTVPAVVALSSPAFGMGAPTGRRQVTVPLPPGAAACFYTDGLADVIVDGERLGLGGLAAEIRSLSPEEGAQELVDRLVERSDAQPDDMAAFVLRPPAEAPAPRVGRIEELEVDARDVERGRLGRYLAEYGVTDGVAEAATRAVLNALERAHAVVIEINHDAAGATVSVMDSPDVVALPLAPPMSEDDAAEVASA